MQPRKSTQAITYALILLLFVGCVATQKKPTDEELISNLLGKLKNGLETQNLDEIMACFAENFYDPEVGDKAGLRRAIQNYYDDGDLKNAKLSLDNISLEKVDKQTYNVTSVKLQANFGKGILHFTVGKQPGNIWQITRLRFQETY